MKRVLAATLLLLAFGIPVAARTGGPVLAANQAAGSVVQMPLTAIGTTNARSLAEHGQATEPSAANEHYLLGPEGTLPRTNGGAQAPGAPVANLGVGGSSKAFGFSGITGKEQATANAAYDLEPPDQGLCSNGSEVVENVNNAYAVYSTTGAQLLAPIAMTSLFGIPSEQPTGGGSFTSDPRCYFDAATNRWFVVELSIPNFFSPHVHASKSYELIAVSDSSDPTGNFSTFATDSTDQSDPGCPCFGDYPMIGADAYGFYVSCQRGRLDSLQTQLPKGEVGSQAHRLGAVSLSPVRALANPHPGERLPVHPVQLVEKALADGDTIEGDPPQDDRIVSSRALE